VNQWRSRKNSLKIYDKIQFILLHLEQDGNDNFHLQLAVGHWWVPKTDQSQLLLFQTNPGYFVIVTIHLGHHLCQCQSRLVYVLLNLWCSQQCSPKNLTMTIFTFSTMICDQWRVSWISKRSLTAMMSPRKSRIFLLWLLTIAIILFMATASYFMSFWISEEVSKAHQKNQVQFS